MTNEEQKLPDEMIASEAQPKPYANAGDLVVSEAVAVPVVPTQMANPRRASWRTALFAIIATLPIINLAFLSLQTILAEYGLNVETMPGWAWAVLNGGIIISGIVAKWVNSIALMPKVNDWLTNSLGVGPVPKNSAK